MLHSEKIKKSDGYGISRLMYIIEAALEYFISMLVSGAYLAKATSEIGLSDSITGILSSFVSLGCGFQMLAIFLVNKRPVKRWVTALHILNQTFFALIYVVPFFKIPTAAKAAVFIAFLLLGHIINNVVNSPKINYFMSTVDDRKRGSFTATKEIISLIGGMLFSFVSGLVIDSFDAAGNTEASFIYCGVTIFILMLLHTATLLFSREKPVQALENHSVKDNIRELIRDKGLFKVILISVLWNVANYSTTPFHGTYQIKELGFSMTYVSVISIVMALSRSLFSKPLGKYADRYSFVKMLNICFTVELVAFAVFAFTVPENGHVLYIIYTILHAIGMAGINSGAINLIYDYVDKERRTSALALKSTFAGFAGFFTTLAVSPLVEHIQNNGNKFLGINLYAQQITSVIGFLMMIVILAYINLAFAKKGGQK